MKPLEYAVNYRTYHTRSTTEPSFPAYFPYSIRRRIVTPKRLKQSQFNEIQAGLPKAAHLSVTSSSDTESFLEGQQKKKLLSKPFLTAEQ
jgi:hypothetical protein